jgi:predicted transposase YbfD/YdcC
VHLLAAYVPDDGLVLGQEAVDGKGMNSGRTPSRANLRRRVVGADALLTQRDIARQIRRQGGDYVFYAKDNQRHLLADIRCLFSLRPARPGWFRHALPATVATTVDKQHGRLERRTLTLIPDADGFLDWPGACQVFRLQRHTTTITTGRVRQETVYGLTSLPPATCDAQRLLHLTRSFWSIENGLHYRRDVTLQEDATRMHHRNQAASMATLNNFVVGLLSMLGFTNFASAQRRFADGLMRTLMALLFL